MTRKALKDVLVGDGPLLMFQFSMTKDDSGKYLDPVVTPVVAASVCVDLEGKDEPPKCANFRCRPKVESPRAARLVLAATKSQQLSAAHLHLHQCLSVLSVTLKSTHLSAIC